MTAVGIDFHDLSTYDLKKTELAAEIYWLFKSIHARKDLVSVFVHYYIDGLIIAVL